MFIKQIRTKWEIFIDDLPRMLPTMCPFIWQSGFRKDFLEINQSETRIAFGGHVCFRNRNLMSNLYKVPYKDASYHVLVHLAKRLQRRFFRNQPIRNKICLCCHVCERIGTKWSIFIKSLSMILPTKLRSIWPSGFRGDDFLEIDQSETRIACGSHVF